MAEFDFVGKFSPAGGDSIAANNISLIACDAFADNNGANSGTAFSYSKDAFTLLGQQHGDAGANLGSVTIGPSVGAAGDVVAIGGWRYSSDTGAVYLYDANMVFSQRIQANDAQAGDDFGCSVSVGESYIAVGARDASGGGGGAVYIFNIDGSLFNKISSPESAGFTDFGRIVYLYGDKVAIAAGTSATNDVYLYNVDGTMLGSVGGLGIARGLAINSQYVFVGDDFSSEEVSNAGAVFVYDHEMNLVQTIFSNDIGGFDSFGYFLVANETRIAIAALGQSSYSNSNGAVYVFNMDFTLLQRIVGDQFSLDPEAFDSFGYKMAIGNDRLYISSFEDIAGESIYSFVIDNTVPSGASFFWTNLAPDAQQGAS